MDKRVVDQHYEQSESEFSSTTALGFINRFLMEEDFEQDYTMFQDSFALQLAEKSFHDAITHTPPPPPPPSSIQHQQNYNFVHSPDVSDNSFSSGSTSSFELDQHYEQNESEFSSTTALGFINQFLMEEDFEEDYTMFEDSFALQLTQKSFNDVITHTPPPPPLPSSSSLCGSTSSFELDPYNPFILPTTLPIPPNFVSQNNSTIFPSFTNALSHEVIKTENFEEEHFLNVSQNESEQVYVEDNSELSELFDKVLVLGTKFTNNSFQQNEELSNRFYGSRRQRSYEEVVDLRTLLILCAQSISCNDSSNANQLIKQMKKHSSTTGDGTQRLAHFFGNALEARLAGTGSHIYRALSSKKKSAADMVRAFQVYSSACPFEKFAIIFSNNAILSVAKETESLHIIDFGVGHGFKWPGFIYRLSKRSGGPPKLRITGIDLPNSLERVNETGLRLASYCKRFDVPFEFNGIAKNWECIKVEDFKIRKNEFVAVNCVLKFEKLLDETVVSENPKGAVLDLIKKVNPNIFVHGIVNGCYDAPFFVTRFKEAVYHYSALFDMLDNINVEREDPIRLMFEEEFWGKDIMNVIACEGCDRVLRPETYRQWHFRHMENGFKSLKLDKQIIDKLKGRLRNDAYSSDFVFEVNENWMLQGWKGRILFGSSCWVPA